MKILQQEIEQCRACALHRTRNHVIFGEGNLHAPIVLIGEAPGAVEDRVGRPFVGKSGQLLEKILHASGFSREEHVFLTNIIRCRPPNNRPPTREEVDACISFLHRQIDLLDPSIIVTLGATALKNYLGDNSLKITKLRGKWLEFQGRQIMPVYHPSALLRSPHLKKDTWEDFKQIITRYRAKVNPDHYSAHF